MHVYKLSLILSRELNIPLLTNTFVIQESRPGGILHSIKMHRYFILNKPYQVLCHFGETPGKKTLRDIVTVPKNIYPVGRLDEDSEGLLLLTDDTSINQRLLHPSFKHERIYHVQVEGSITEAALKQIANGVTITVNHAAYLTAPCKASLLKDINHIVPRNPPVRYRASIPDSWIQLTLTEGKNRQVRKMTASVGYPTLRLIRHSIGAIQLGGLLPGAYKKISRNSFYQKLFEENE